MKKYITNILIFFVIICTIDICIGKVGDYLQSHAKGGDTKVFDDLVMKDKHNILILGSSRAHHHYDAPYMSEVLGVDVYNAGYDGNGVVLSYGILSMIVERYNPKLVVFDVEPTFDIYEYKGDNNNKRYIKNLKPYFRNSNIGNIITNVSMEEWYKAHSGMMRYNTSIVQKVLDYYRMNKSSNHGYVPLYGEYTGDVNKPEDTDATIDSLKLEFFEELLDITGNNNVKIMVVASPRYGSDNSDVLNPLFDICKKNKVQILDYYADDEFMQHKEWFKEPMHLNNVGAKIFSSIVCEEINKIIQINNNANRFDFK